MKRQRRNIFFFIVLMALLVVPNYVRAYQIDTHAFLTDETFRFYNNTHQKKIEDTLRAFLIDGARREDDAPRWMNHFYDPVHERGLSNDGATKSIIVGNWDMSKKWAEDGVAQNSPIYKIPTAIASILTAFQRWKISELTSQTDFTWQEAIRQYANGDEEKAFFTLGHVIHLIQDASVPAHTRNDAHAEGDPYELYAEKYTLSTPDENLSTRLKGKEPIVRSALADYFKGLATYSNNNFYSEDTIGIQSGYEKPNIDISEFQIKNGLVYLNGKDEEGNVYYFAVKKSLKSLITDFVSNVKLDDEVRGSYWNLLSTKSVQYGAGVIDLFLSEAEKAKNDPNFYRGEKKSFLGKLVDGVKLGIGAIGAMVGEIFNSDHFQDNNQVLFQDPPSAPDIEDDLFGDTNNSEIVANLQKEEDTNEMNIMSQEQNEVLLEDDVSKDTKQEEVEDKKEKEEELMSEETGKKEEFQLCVFDEKKKTNERTVIVNEVAWMGTKEGSTKEWFELKNTAKYDVNVGDWQILDYDNEIKIKIPKNTIMKPNTFLLFERGSDDSVPNETADVVYTGNLSNNGTKKTEGIRVYDAACIFQDEVLAVPWWPAGDNEKKLTMERDKDGVGWHTASIVGGTPKKENSEKYMPTVTSGGSASQEPTYFSARINEIFYNAPGSDAGKEWIEIQNDDNRVINFEGWKLYENETNHTLSLAQGSFLVAPGAFAVIANDAKTFLSEHPSFSGNLFESTFSLSNDGETIAIKNGTLSIDSVSYSSSTGAYGDGNSLQKINGIWKAALPTPGEENKVPNQNPIASFSVTPSEPIAGNFVYFESSSTDPDGTIETTMWTFGDGMSASGSSSVSHMYAQEGTYEVTLSVTDDKGASASSSQVIVVSSSSTVVKAADHVVFSEILFKNASGRYGEFVELYNPTDTSVDLKNWSLRYYIGNATTSNSLGVFNDTKDHVVIPPKGFFLIGIHNYATSSFDGIIPDVLRTSYSLPDSDEWVSVVLLDAAGQEIDAVRYTKQSANAGESLERKTIYQNSCTNPFGDEEFNGNVCDRGSDGDFVVRTNPRPQNSSSLPEPRAQFSPVLPREGESSVAVFDKNTMQLVFSWKESTSTDAIGAPTYVIEDKNGEHALFNVIETTATTSAISLAEVGKTYVFSLSAKDSEGYASQKREYSVTVPRFLSRVYAYPDPRRNDGQYVIDMYWGGYPFVPQTKGGRGWQAIVFYKNSDPNSTNSMLSASDNYAVSDQTNVLPVFYKQCGSGSVGAERNVFVMPLGSEWCSNQGGDLYPQGLGWQQLEDHHALVYTKGLKDGDYLTAGYYDRNAFGHFELVAVDKTKVYVQNAISEQYSPELSGNIKTSFNENTSALTISLPSATDRDSIDSELVYEINFSPNTTSTLDESLWNTTTTASEYTRNVAPGDMFLIGVRAYDDFGNVSRIATTTWEYPKTQFFITQPNVDGWSAPFGKVSFSTTESDTASFQSFAPESDFSLNTVVIKIKQEMTSDFGTLRLSVLGSAGTTTPDFSQRIAETTLEHVFNPDPDEEKTFLFSSPVNVLAGNTYWFVLDVANYSNGGGYQRNTWSNATMSGGNAYVNGISGEGRYRGQNAMCDNVTVCGFIPNPNTDWYMKIGTKQ